MTSLTRYSHDDLRHGLYTMYTDWVVIDPYTKEIEMGECWACRRMGKGSICLIKGRRIRPRDPTDPDSRYRILPPNGGGQGGPGGGHQHGHGNDEDEEEDEDDGSDEGDDEEGDDGQTEVGSSSFLCLSILRH